MIRKGGCRCVCCIHRDCDCKARYPKAAWCLCTRCVQACYGIANRRTAALKARRIFAADVARFWRERRREARSQRRRAW